ncbi:hypothetical protein UFOVP908_125 [uncultured Caudovirales phage]|uniref:Prohead core protein n=1 Tax=uncultured Caudovirales phage TaxID=2100421 RepID=A0A6J5Q3U7_9CAUD|nr:hypothetical protein UFOVP908_125 [uncultured Caudovirales phage]CAB4176181.1 hypothetical protein UFOVP990_11 [uncultured Caudovirales phage]CAB4181584.1 hypothetical protein UFOVP1065_42 [uncultured Caudovirales phage]CAB4189719.1 hypothetical protein UFOVP1198_11 [uncultured Caudovirales phage]CAB4210318.1 hypothetical protein UFOVP1418_3 [uncultured Caudovirales phage]
MKLVEAIDSKNFESANDLLAEKFHSIMERKMFEVKKMVAAEMCGQGSGFARTKNEKLVDQDVLEEEPSTGEESSMARSELASIAKNAKSIMAKVKGNKELEAWTQSKITKAADYMTSVSDYMDSEKLDEARIAIIKARIRGGKVQRRKRVSNVPGFTLRGGKLTRMSASERRRRKLGARVAARKTKQKQSQSLRKRKLSLMKRSRLGI